MRSFRRRFATALALGTLVSTGGAIAGGGDDLIACRTKGQIKVLKNGWTRIAAPPVDAGEGAAKVTDFTTPPRLSQRVPARMYATNGTVAKFSADSGCTWNLLDVGPRFRPPNGQSQPVPEVIAKLSAPNDQVLWTASYENTGGVPRPHVRLLENLGPEAEGPPLKTQVENGLPAVGKPVEFLSSPAEASAAFLLVEQPPDAASGDIAKPARKLFGTTVMGDPPQAAVLGLLWKEITPPQGFGRVEGITLGTTPRSLWMWSDTKVAVTADHTVANSWKVSSLRSGTVVGVDVSTAGDALVALETAQRGVAGVRISPDGTVSGDVQLPVAPVSMTHGAVPQTRAISGNAGTWGFDARAKRWVNITPKGVGALHGLRLGAGLTTRILLGRTDDAIYRFDLYAGEGFIADGTRGPMGDWPDLPDSDIKQAYITPVERQVVVKPGEVKNVPVEFGMPPSVNPLDVYFLVDTTGSMQNVIVSLRSSVAGIASKLRRELGREACFGVGDFKDFIPTEPANVFRTHQKITCEGESLPKVTTALTNLKSSGGGDDPEAQTIALSQMITGDGQTTPFVAPGNDAGFRHDAYKVAVMITDAKFKQAAGYPTMDAVAQKLKVNAIKLVNVLVLTDLDPALARRDMSIVAEATDSLAPPGGVDCDGDGTVGAYDVPPGQPLICETSGSEPNIGPLITTLLLGVEDPGTLSVAVDDPENAVREPIRGSTSQVVNLKREARIKFTVPVSCTPQQDGLDLPVSLTPTRRALPVGLPTGGTLSGGFVVQCRATPKPIIEIPRPPRRPELPVPPEPPVVEIPKVPMVVAVPPPPNPPAQPPSNINPNAGFSQQEEQQFQLAAVTQGAGEEAQQEEEVELAMSRLDRDLSATPVAAFLAGATVISAAAGVAYRRRLQRAARPVYVRSR